MCGGVVMGDGDVSRESGEEDAMVFKKANGGESEEEIREWQEAIWDGVMLLVRRKRKERKLRLARPPWLTLPPVPASAVKQRRRAVFPRPYPTSSLPSLILDPPSGQLRLQPHT